MKNAANAINARVVYGKLFLQGNLSFFLTIFLLLPSFLRPKIDSIKSFSIYGKPFIFPKDEGLAMTALIFQIIANNQYHTELIKKGGVVVDAGANIGVFSIFVAANNPEVTIYAFEPTPSTFEVLKENTKYWNNIKIFNCGLGEKEAMASIIIANHSGANYIGQGGIPIEIKTIDSFNLPVDFIKMDTEGYEANIMKGATETIKKYKPVIVMSAYHKTNDSTELPKLLKGISAYNCELRFDCEEDLICTPINL